MIHLIHFHISVYQERGSRAREECHPDLDYPRCNPPLSARVPHQVAKIGCLISPDFA